MEEDANLAGTNADLIKQADKWGYAKTIVTPEMLNPPSGFVNLFVYQPNPIPRWADHNSVGPYLKALNYWTNCRGGGRIFHLRIMGHGTTGSFRIGNDYIDLSVLANADGTLTPVGEQLKDLRDCIDPARSLVIIDACLCGQGQDLLMLLSDLWGGVAVRGYRDYQYWEAGRQQIGHGLYSECSATECKIGIEIFRASTTH